MRLPRPKASDLFFASVIFFALAVAVVLLQGCATFGPPRPPTFPAGMDRAGAEQAAWIVWNSTYGRTDMPPLVRWITGKDLDCDDLRAGKRGFWVLEVDPDDPDQKVRMRCDQGDTWSAMEVFVAWHGDEISFSETVIAHEFAHAFLLRKGIFVGHHERPDFFPMIDRANQALRDAGK